MTMAWYDCLLLKNRTLTEHEKRNLNHVGISCMTRRGDELIGPKGGGFSRPRSVALTHYHHVNNLLAMMVCYVDPTVKSLSEYPVRDVQRTAEQRPVYTLYSPVPSAAETLHPTPKS